MKAVDANVLLRLIVGDDPHQEQVALALIARESVFVPLTVTMECEWVLRSFYKWPRARIADAIGTMMDVENIIFEQAAGVRWCLERLRGRADFADMIYIVQAAVCEMGEFATFDTGVADEAGSGSPLPVTTLA